MPARRSTGAVRPAADPELSKSATVAAPRSGAALSIKNQTTADAWECRPRGGVPNSRFRSGEPIVVLIVEQRYKLPDRIAAV